MINAHLVEVRASLFIGHDDETRHFFTGQPGVGFTDTADFLFHKSSKLAHENLFPVLGTPDQVIGQLIRNLFGVLCIHTQQYTMCSNPCPCEGRLPPR